MINNYIDITDPFYDPSCAAMDKFHLGDRVRIIESKQQWAIGKTGVINNIIATTGPNLDNLNFGHKRSLVILIDDMDRMKPPFGMCSAYPYEIELIKDEEESQEEPKHLKINSELVIQKLNNLNDTKYFSKDVSNTLDETVRLIQSYELKQTEILSVLMDIAKNVDIFDAEMRQNLNKLIKDLGGNTNE